MLRIIQTAASTYGQQQQYVPLKNVTIKANIKSFAADVTIKQIFCNNESLPIEAVYCFPIEEQAAIYSFIAKIDDRQIIAQLKEKKQAQQEYNQALQQGHGAYLLEQDKKSQDNFIINIGALPPGKECHIEISYVTELDLVQNGTKIRFVVPTTIAPRYNPNKGGITSPAGTTTNYVQLAPYTIDFHCQIDKLNIARISSTSHPIQIDLSHQDIYVIEFGQQNTHLDRDILIDIELEENRSNTILAIESGAIMASFTPNQQDCQHAIDSREVVTNEFIFVVDCSGSMKDENKIGYARQAMLLFLKSLPLNCHFNIIRFGSTYESLFKDITVVYNKEHAQQAEQLTNNMQANLGGTELLRSLQWLNEHPSKEGRARQIFLLTDGEISNVDEVLDLCRLMSSSTRIFSFGLGRSPSRSLVKGLARATNGHFVFIPPDTNVDVYVGEQLEKALQSSITNIQVKWNLGRNVTNVPTTPPPVYVNNRLIVYALITDDNNESGVFDHNSSVELYNDKHRLGEAKVNRIPNVVDNGTISRLAGKALILELQHSKLSSSSNKSGSRQTRFEQQAQEATTKILNDDKEERKKRIIELSLKYNILSPYTAFVGIEKRVNGNNADMVLREVPIQISADDQYLQTPNYMNSLMKSNASINYQCSMPIHAYRQSVLSRTARSTQIPPVLNYNYPSSPEFYESSIAPSYPDWNSQCYSQSDFNKNYEKYTPLLPTSSCWMNPNDLMISKKQKTEETFPPDDENKVRYLINKQMFDGHWELNSQVIEQLTSKPLSHFQQSTNSEVLITAIVIIVLETRFTSFSSMWHGVVQKARQHLLGLLSNDNNKLNTLLEEIGKTF